MTPLKAGTVVALFPYTAMLSIAYLLKTRAMDVVLFSTWSNLCGYALLLPAGIVTLRHKQRTLSTVLNLALWQMVGSFHHHHTVISSQEEPKLAPLNTQTDKITWAFEKA